MTADRVECRGLHETLAMPGWSVAARTLLAEDGS